MKHTSVQYICDSCGDVSQKWQGKCLQCGEWNTYKEQNIEQTATLQRVQKRKGETQTLTKTETIVSLEELLIGDTIPVSDILQRSETGIGELDRVFGGGLVKGSISIMAGEPGIGKSTLTLTLCHALAKKGKSVMYMSGEESIAQIGARAHRMKIKDKNIALANENIAEKVVATALDRMPDILVVDSVQVMYAESMSGAPGSIGQIRFVTELLMEVAKNHGITVILIGHVTKEGSLAGPRVLEHLVDTVLLLDGERSRDLRILRTDKNRFGSTDEIGVFTMKEEGLVELENASQSFLEGRQKGASGSVVTATMEGTRAFLLEIQALTTYTKFGYPKRTAVGMNLNRIQLILAVITKFTNLSMDSHDVYINAVGGLYIKETGIDLAIILSLLSSRLQKSLPDGLIAFGEVGLTGEVRSVNNLEKRVKEAEKLGMNTCVLPTSANVKETKKMKLLRVNHVKEVLQFFK